MLQSFSIYDVLLSALCLSDKNGFNRMMTTTRPEGIYGAERQFCARRRWFTTLLVPEAYMPCTCTVFYSDTEKCLDSHETENDQVCRCPFVDMQILALEYVCNPNVDGYENL
jgi:hypothetical protein